MKLFRFFVLILALVLPLVSSAFTLGKPIWKSVLKAALFNDDESERFEKFATKWGKDYITGDKLKKKAAIWKKNMAKIEKINSENHGYELEENFFTDLDDDEKREYAMDYSIFEKQQKQIEKTMKRVKRDATQIEYVGEKKDWRGPAMAVPRAQGRCASCYAFAAVNAIEVQWNSRPGNPYLELSEQQIVDCAGAGGCRGGNYDPTFKYLLSAGCAMRADYPYTANETECKVTIGALNDSSSHISGPVGSDSAQTSRFRRLETEPRQKLINGWYDVRNVPDIEYYVYTKGPVVFGFLVPDTLYSYKAGIYNVPSTECNATNNLGGHAMSIVGYGTENGVPYWICRNMLGSKWGDGGYIRMQRGADVCRMESWGVFLPWVVGQKSG